MPFSLARDRVLNTHGTNDVGWAWKDLQDDPPRPSKVDSNKHKPPPKRSFAGLADITSNDATKKRKVDPQQAPRHSADSSLFVRATDSPASGAALPKVQAKPATPALLNNPFEDSDSDSPPDVRPIMPPPKRQPPPKTLGSGPQSTPMDDRKEALAQSARMRKEAAERKKARHTERSARPTPALASAEPILEVRARDIAPASRAYRTSQTRPAQVSGHRKYKSQPKDSHPVPTPAEVISLDSDTDDAPTSSARPIPRPVAPVLKARDAVKGRLRPAAPSVKQEPRATFREQLAEVKKERPISPAVPSQPSLLQVIDLTRTNTATGIETAAYRRKRLRDEAAKSAAERLQQERQRAEDHAKALEERLRLKHDADVAVKREEEEKARDQLARDAEARKAAIKRQHQLELAKQRQDDADAQRNKLIQEQLERTREEKKQKKAIEDAEREKKKVVDEAKREAERQRVIEEKRAQLAKRPPVLDEQAQHERDERIRLKRERAARNKKRQEEEEDGGLILEATPDPKIKSMAARAREAQVMEAPFTVTRKDDDDVEACLSEACEPTPTLDARPTSLNSAAGLRAVGSSAKPMRQVPCTGATQSDRTSHKRALGELLPEDVCIIKWRDTEGSSWEQIKDKYLELTGKSRAEKTLRSRFQQVSGALNAAKVDSSLRRRLLQGNEEARRDVNIAVHGEWPVPQKSANAVAAETGDKQGTHQTAKFHINPATNVVWPPPAVGHPHSQPANLLAQGTMPSDLLPSPGEILPVDALLFRWRESKMAWPEIVQKYQKTTGVRLSLQLLRQRYREVEDALKSAWVMEDEIEALSHDLPGARAKVNGKVWTTWPPVLEEKKHPETPAKRQRSRPPNVSRNDSLLDGPIALPPLPSTTFAPRMRAAETTNLCADVRASSPAEIRSPQHPRPTTGGKAPTWALLKECMENAAEVCNNHNGAEDCHSEVDASDPDDYTYFVYRIFRRDYTLEEEESGVDIEEIAWQESANFEDLDEANKSAYGEVSLKLPGAPAYTEGDFHMTNDLRQTDYGGFRHITVVSPGVGQLDIRVAPILRTIKDGILPKSKQGSIVSTTYNIKQCTIRKNFDAALNKTTIEKETDVLNGTLTSHLGIANKRAIAIFVDITRKRHPRLEIDDAERRERVEYFKGELAEHEDGEEAVFDQTHLWSENRSIRVWVSPSKMSGPRNHFQFCVGP